MVSYKQVGVDIAGADRLVKKIKRLVPKVGGFSGLFPLDKKRYLAGSCDGVGTKLKIAQLMNKHDTIGIDLVAMSVNDLLCCGAKPLFFLDYLSCGKLSSIPSEKIIKGIVKGCNLADCLLLGGETAEMPGFYPPGEYDLAGFCVGIVEKSRLIDGKKIKPGDILIGLPSSGLHSNGYSLVRKVLLEKAHYKVNTKIKGLKKSLGEELLMPTRIYAQLLSTINYQLSTVHGLAHITGGGMIDKLGRILPPNCQAVIDRKKWKVPSIFKLIQEKGNIPDQEMFHTFNMGIGMILVVSKVKAQKYLDKISGSRNIGQIVRGKRGVQIS